MMAKISKLSKNGVVKMDLIATVNVLCKVKNVKEGKDKVSGAPNGVLYVSAAHDLYFD